MAAYGQLWDCDFVAFDDGDYVTANDMVKRGLSWEGVVWAFSTTHASNWHPLTWISHMVDFQLYGLNPAGHPSHQSAVASGQFLSLLAFATHDQSPLAGGAGRGLFGFIPCMSSPWPGLKHKDIFVTLFQCDSFSMHGA